MIGRNKQYEIAPDKNVHEPFAGTGQQPSIADLVMRIDTMAKRGEPVLGDRAVGRLMTLLERDPSLTAELYRQTAASQIGEQHLYPKRVLGITGSPGTGKSTFTDALIRLYRKRMPRLHIGVIAVDPSSPFVGGAVLGDRVRMMDHATDDHVFVRSMASRGHLGGLSLGVKGVMHVMALAGCDLVIIETVGVGQSEIEIAGAADIVTVVLAPGQGDSIQLLKSGLMEVGDLFVVNKADRQGAESLYAQLLAILAMDHSNAPDAHPSDGREQAAWQETLTDPGMRAPAQTRAFMVSSIERTGLEAVFDEIESRCADQASSWSQRRASEVRQAIRQELKQAVIQRTLSLLTCEIEQQTAWHDRIEKLLAGQLSTDAAARRLLSDALSAANEDANCQKQVQECA